MRNQRMLSALFSVCIITLGAVSQSDAPRIFTGAPPASLTEQLKRYHVDLTQQGLLNGLRSPDEHVRYLSALRLAEVRDMDAVPAITEALAAEKIPATRINIAIALAQLGQEKGIEGLTAACGESNLPGYLRARAVSYLLSHGREICFTAVLGLLSVDADSRIQALTLLPRYRHLSNQESDEVLHATARCLTDESPAVREQASAALNALANPLAIPYLQSAIAREQDDTVRSQMRASLDLLKKKQGP